MEENSHGSNSKEHRRIKEQYITEEKRVKVMRIEGRERKIMKIEE